jgi:hypothetical protein
MAQTTAVVPAGLMQDVKKPGKLEDQAAIAALYVTRHDNSKTGHEFLDSNNKLSSAGKLQT